MVPYDPAFLGGGFEVPLPTPVCTGRLFQTGAPLDYIYASIVMHADRRSALFSAHNIDASRRFSVPRTDWDLDPRATGIQTPPGAYTGNVWDRGHLVRRAAVAFGDSEAEARAASDATFYYTNAALQHERFNQDEWVHLEDWVLGQSGSTGSRLCVFTGPIYTRNDQTHRGFRVPSAFWKVVVLRDPAAEGEDLAAIGFVMKQNELWHDWNGAATLDLTLYQVGIREIGRYAGLEFGQLALLDEFEWRQARFRSRGRMRPVKVSKPEDIEFHGHRRRSLGVRALRSGPPSAPTEVASGPEAVRHCPSCEDRSGVVDERVEFLSREVDALRDVVDELLARDKGSDDGERRASASLALRNLERIVGGETVAPGTYPDCACIGDEDRWFCSGVLIHPRIVLTAAHCAPGISQVFLGGRSVHLAGQHGEVVEVEHVLVHPDYDPDLVPSHDIAVLVLATDSGVEPASIASQADVDQSANVELVGFGFNHPSMNIGFGTKRRANLGRTVLHDQEEEAVALSEALHGFDNTFEMHAGRKELGIDSCNGDSGGPAYVYQGDAMSLAALTSRASFSSEKRCGDGGIYTRVVPYLGWISAAVGEATDGAVSFEAPAPDHATGPETDFIYLSAALPNPTGSDFGNEWIEVSNASGEAVALGRYAVGDKQGARETLSGSLSGGATHRFRIPAGSQVQLSNRGDEVRLYRDGMEIQREEYGKVSSGEVVRFHRPETGDGTGEGEFLEWADPC
ncbi:MAG: DNA/RNA non-specific endonuclease [Kiloniellales bacterium]|nr:DNA/RNA non-specific endonuclease [Kiloniellales bacterium]